MASRTHGTAGSNNLGRLLAVLALSAGYMLVEAIGGVLTGSLALLADAGHMLADVLGLAMAVAAIWFARRPATPTKTFGFYRAEILAALANSLVLFAIGGYVLWEAWQRFTAPTHPEINSLPMLFVAVGGIAVNVVGILLLRGGAHESLNVRGAFLEVLTDLVSSVGVILAAIVVLFTGWWQADAVVSALIGIFILPRTWHLLKSALDVLLEATPSHVNVAAVQNAMQRVPGVAAVHDLHVWTITSGFVALSGHVLAKGRTSDAVLHDVQDILRHDFGIQHSTLQVEQGDHPEDIACCTPDPRCLVVGEFPLHFAAIAAPATDDK